MYVIKRDGRHEKIYFDKITKRLEILAEMHPKLDMDVTKVTTILVSQITSGMKTTELDNLASEICFYLSSSDYNYSQLALRVAVSNLHKETKESFIDKTNILRHRLNDQYLNAVENYGEQLQSHIKYERDYNYDYFGMNTMIKMYLLRLDVSGSVIERPQDMLMRVAIQINLPDGPDFINRVVETYELMSNFYYTPATPTLLNSGLKRNSLSSCFLLTLDDDSVENMYDAIKSAALITKAAGGMSICLSNIRSAGSLVKSTSTGAAGIIPYIKVIDSTGGHLGQRGKSRRSGIAMYLDCHHAEFMDFLQLKNNSGKEELRARNLFYGNMIPDLFMKRVINDEQWSFFDPAETPGLYRKYGEEYERDYLSYEQQGLAKSKMPARKVLERIAASMIETGSYYCLFKDHINNKNAQKNLGTITSSNLCSEITLYSSDQETAVCNLSSICLPKFTDGVNYDFDRLARVVRTVVRNLNRTIDASSCPTDASRLSNSRNRPIGLGVQGLADVFFKHRFPYVSPEAERLNKQIFETIYYASLSASCELAKEQGTYETYIGSPASQGILQPDMWGVVPDNFPDSQQKWQQLREDIKRYGLRNSTLVALMPTASTSQIMGNTECFEPITSNIYSRKTFAGDFVVVNKYLIEDLKAIGKWNEETKSRIILNDGSIRDMEYIPLRLREIYKTVWEYSQRDMIKMAADRGPYVDQTQSMNLYFSQPTTSIVASALRRAWEMGLKTGCYYLRTKAIRSADRVTVKDGIGELNVVKKTEVVCNDEEGCTICSS